MATTTFAANLHQIYFRSVCFLVLQVLQFVEPHFNMPQFHLKQTTEIAIAEIR